MQRGEAGVGCLPVWAGRSPVSQLLGPMFPVGKDLAGLLRLPSGRDTSVLPESDQQAPTPPVPGGHGGAPSVNLRQEWLC